jgi:hypothetical protein
MPITIQVPLQNRRLQIAEGLPLTSVLADELAAFRVKITLAGNETFEAWRERDHDDLVLAVAMALYLGSFPPTLVSVIELNDDTDLAPPPARDPVRLVVWSTAMTGAARRNGSRT